MSVRDPQADPVLAEFPLSAGQTRCWIIDRANPGTITLNVAVRWEVTGPLREAELEQAFRQVIARHEILRTAFAETESGPVQRVHASAPFQLSLVDLRRVPAEDQMARVDAIARETAAEPFDLSKPGLIRATLVRLAAERAILCFCVHQNCFDGFSIRVLGREIGAALTGMPLPEPELQYGDFTLWQREMLEATGDQDLAYWTETLAGMPYFEMPPDHPRPARSGGEAGIVARDLPEGFGPALAEAARKAGVSPFTLGCAVFGAALHRITGATDLAFGTQIAGRMDTELEPLIGIFINNLALRQRPAPAATLAEHIASLRPVIEGALIHQTLPFNRLVEALNPPRDPARTPLISINFNLQSVFMETRRYGEVEMRSMASHAPGVLYDLDLAVMERPSGWQIVLEYAAPLFERETAQAILDTVVAAFDMALSAPETRLADLPLHGAPRLVGEAMTVSGPLAEIETALAAHPSVAEAVAVADGDGAFGFVTPAATGTFPLERLPEALLSDLGEPRLTGVSVLAALPRTQSGAPDRAALRVPARRAAVAVPDARMAETLAVLRADWAELLGVAEVPATGHFFDLGGHSLLVLRLLARLRDRWGVAIDLPELYEAPVLSDFAALVAARRGAAPTATPRDDGLMRLKRDGAGTPFTAVNNAATATALSTLPGFDRPVACIRLPADAPPLAEDTPFEAVARSYADQMRALQPEGPYLLYGNCVHGNLALETARVLHDQGARVAVAMKDVWEPGYVAGFAHDAGLARQDRRHSLRLRLRYWREGEMSTAALLGSYGIFHRTGLLRALRALRLVGHANRTDLEAAQEAFILTMSRARDRYRPAPVDFPVLHIVTDATPRGGRFSPSIGWEAVIGPDHLTTVHLDRVYVSRSKRIGVEEMAAEIEAFAGAQT
ncbi:condensation domain-containing protein [Jannaschia seohaensis]|uniref:AMP-binding enzyme n=1 Tax=Jannaschia seohaensis TaxID=475081 RepID=A0A2Y9A2E7_9RHOB|nr:condensation domain-containing protein [Jannaschia seohaensis]PWJ22177.1 AMP-binding enzyme [Jannaschia seohaensis]SSA38455.1 AMP-binding enzyme C-terminal domain-containing protein [Jannaschia seohaensis]